MAYAIEAGLHGLTTLRLRLLTLDAVLPFQYTVGLYISSGVIMAVGAGLVTVLFSPAAAGAGVALVMTNLNGINVPRLLETQVRKEGSHHPTRGGVESGAHGNHNARGTLR